MKTLFVGRFQPFHNGHLLAIKEISSFGELTIVVGSANKLRTKNNPFSVGERLKMLKLMFENKFEFLPVPDFDDHVKWTSYINEKINFDIVYSMNKWTLECFKKNGFKTGKHKLYKRDDYWATKIREKLANGEDIDGLVPKKVNEYLKKIGAGEIIKGVK